MIRYYFVLASILSLAVSLGTARSAVAQSDGSPVTVPTAAQAESTAPVRQRTPDRERTLPYWAQQLSNPRFLRRESAERHLIQAGPDAVPLLVQTLRGADLETTRRVIGVLSRIAAEEQPAVTDGAYAALELLAKDGIGSKATIAATTLEDTGEARQLEARNRLTQNGIFVGEATVALGSQSAPRMIARLDSNWNQTPGSLSWLRWLTDVEFALIEGDAAQKSVLGAVAQMPDLKTLVIAECELDAESITALQSLKRLDAIELRYVRLNEEMIQELTRLPIRNAVYLMGNGVTNERVAQMQLEMPGVEINCRQGGFLGVVCRDPRQRVCVVSNVLPDSAADEAGLVPGDVIIQIDDAKILRFEDLQAEINLHLPGDEITIRYQRNEEVVDAKAKLGKLVE